jgi:hypothetical protein
MAQHRPTTGKCTRVLGWSWHQGYWLLVDPIDIQVTHATDSDTNAERDYIVAELSKNRVIRDVESYQSGQHLSTERVNHYVTDGEVTLASLV